MFVIMISSFMILIALVILGLMNNLNDPINVETIYNFLYYMIALATANIVMIIVSVILHNKEKKDKLLEEGYVFPYVIV